MANHTPTPWRVTPVGYLAEASGGFIPICTPFKYEANRDKHGGANEQAEANAAFIVRAVNAHDELLEFIQNLRDLAADGMYEEIHAEIHGEHCGRLLAKAESLDGTSTD